jgi:enoyl-CoA hydratase
MPIIRCTKCHIVVLDTISSLQKDVTCNECGSRYRIKVEGDKVAYLGLIKENGEVEEIKLEEDELQSDSVIYKKSGKIAYIILNRPEKLNRIDANMRADIMTCISALERDDNAVLGIIKGNGTAFSAGVETNAGIIRYGQSVRSDGRIRRPSQRAKLWVGRDEQRFINRIRNCSKPLICQAHGSCFDDALAISIVCDLTIASEECLFGYPDPEQRKRFGGMLGLNGAREVSLIGAKKARELHLLGTKIDAREAERIGLINFAVPRAQLEAKVEKIAHDIASLPKDALFLGKEGTKIALSIMEPSSLQPVVMKALSSDIRIETDEQEGVK